MDDYATANIRHHVKGIGELVTPRQLRDFINQISEEALDRPIMLFVDGGCAETNDVDFRNGHLNLY